MKQFRLLFAAVAAATAMLLASCSGLFGPTDSGSSTDPVAKSSVATLSALSVSNGADAVNLSPAFAVGTTAYAVNVAAGTSSVAISATKTDAGATVSGAGTLTLGAAGTTTTATIVVTAEDGKTTKTYTVDVHRASADASTEAHLSALTLSTYSLEWTLDPVFDSGTYAYALNVGNSVSYVDIAATAVDSNAVIAGAGTKTLAVGENTLTVTATAEDGATALSYTITVTRDSPDSAFLGSLSASAGTLSPAFALGTYAYTIALPNAASGTTISATRQYDGPDLEYSTDGSTTLNAFTGSFDVSSVPEGGSKDATIRVRYRSNTETYLDFSITVIRAAQGASSDASLTALSLSNSIVLSPAFDSATLGYTATVPYTTGGANLNFTKGDSGATASMADGDSLDFSVGDNTFELTVTAADGTTRRTYSIVVTRQAAPAITVSSPAAASDQTAGKISVSGTYSGAGIARIELSLSTALGSCTMNSGNFSGTIDASAVPNGSFQLFVAAYDGNDNMIAFENVPITIIGASTTAYAVSGTISNPVSFSGTAYLLIYGMRETDSTPSIFSEYIPVASGDFPYAYSVSGFIQGETYNRIGVLLLTSTPMAGDMSNAIGMGGYFPETGGLAISGDVSGFDLALSAF